MNKKLLAHITCYYTVWFFSILSAAKGNVWSGFIFSIIISFFQYLIELKNIKSKYFLIFVFILTTTGFLVDTVLLHMNLIVFNANSFDYYFSPPWMIGLWINFSAVMYFCLYRYFDRFFVLSILCFFGFPLSYLAGVKLGAAAFLKPEQALITLALLWAILLPLILYFFKKKIENL